MAGTNNNMFFLTPFYNLEVFPSVDFTSLESKRRQSGRFLNHDGMQQDSIYLLILNVMRRMASVDFTF